MNKPHLKILAYEETCLGPLCLRERELLSNPGTMVTEVTLNHEFLMSSFNTDSERVISNRGVEIHNGKSLKTLVGGLGLGYTAAELLKHSNVASVEVIEFLPPVIDWMNQGLIPLSDCLANVDELTVAQGDIYARLLSQPIDTFDLIVIDVDHSPSDQLDQQEHAFYTAAGLERAKTHLKPGGVLAVWSYAQSSDFANALRSTFQQVSVEPVTTMNSLVGHQQTDWLFFGCDPATH
jgi:spermidine synthase